MDDAVKCRHVVDAYKDAQVCVRCGETLWREEIKRACEWAREIRANLEADQKAG